MVMLVLTDLAKTFAPGSVHAKAALRGVDLRLEKGDFVTLLGANGAGKSTLLAAIAGDFPLDRGKILLDGRDITGLRAHERGRLLGRLFQDPLRGTAPGMTVGENLALAHFRAEPGRFPLSRVTGADRRRFRDLLARLELGLEDRLDTRVGLLSGGQRQALTLLMAAAVRPKLLLLDEHTAALDPAAAERILELTGQLAAEGGLTCLMVTHDLAAALALGNRTVLMRQGAVALELRGEERSRMTPEGLRGLFGG